MERTNGACKPDGSFSKKPFDTFEVLVKLGIGLGSSLVENVLSQPFVVFRRQCQINATSLRGHRTPFSVLPVAVNVHLNQGLASLWKGIPSSLVTRGVDTMLDNLLAEVLGSPKVLAHNPPTAKLISHFILKGLSFLLSTPFTVCAYIDSVQSDKVKPPCGIFDAMKEGLARLSNDLLEPQDNRRFTVWYLAWPCVSYRLSHYAMFNAFRSYFYSVVSKRIKKKPKKVAFDAYFPEVFAAFTSNLFAEAVLYPLSTVVGRLYVQGCRVLVDNMDDGSSIVPVTTRYESLTDCVRTIFAEEGIKGFYKGFGALMLQYVMHLALVHGLRKAFTYAEGFATFLPTDKTNELKKASAHPVDEAIAPDTTFGLQDDFDNWRSRHEE